MRQLIFALMLCVFSIPSYGQYGIIPTPSSVIEKTGQIFFEDKQITIQSGVFETETIDFLKKEFELLDLELSESKDADIVFQPLSNIPPEGYNLDIDEKIVITTASASGKFYALMTLLQLIYERKHVIYVQKVSIRDTPAFQWRGLHLDVSRHFFSVDEVKRFIDLMVLYKFNTFHWHLTDDQGWRIEIDKYPKLTSVGAYRDSTVIGHYSDLPRQYNHEKYGGFYTKDQIKDVVAYAKARSVNIVPEIEMPGHSRAALAAYPELSCTGEKQGVPGLWGVFDDIYCSKESSILFMQHVLDEVLELFPYEYIHIGGDEAPKTRWNECSDCAKVMSQNGLHDTHELQSYFISRMDEYLTKKGRTLIGWDEILEGGLSPNAAVMSWRGEQGGIDAAKQGHSVVMSPTSYCYFDYYQSSHESEPLAIGGFLPLKKVYQYSPIPKELSEEEAKFVLGGQANVWTEYIPTFDHVEYMVYPRALALSQSLWCKNKPEYETFLSDYLLFHEEFLGNHDVNFAPSIHFPELHVERAEDGVNIFWTTVNLNDQFSAKSYLGDREDLSEIEKLKNGEKIAINRSSITMPLHFELQSTALEKPLEYTFHPSEILGANIDLVTPANPKYNHNGSLNLVDGILGDGERWKGDQWLGFREKKIEMILELETISELKYLSLGFLNSNGSWIYTPESIEILVSKDKKVWKEVKKATFPQGQEAILRPEIELKTSGKYVKITIHPLSEIPQGKGGAGSTPWTFIDEIQLKTQ